VKSVLVDIFFQNGLVHYNDKGGKDNTTVSVLIQYKIEGASGWTDFPCWNKTIRRNTPDMFRLTTAVSGLDPEKKYLVRVARETQDSINANTRDAVHLGSVRSTRSERPIRSETAKKLMVLALRVKASKLAAGTIDSLNFGAQPGNFKKEPRRYARHKTPALPRAGKKTVRFVHVIFSAAVFPRVHLCARRIRLAHPNGVSDFAAELNEASHVFAPFKDCLHHFGAEQHWQLPAHF
jgi:hypothetical protein